MAINAFSTFNITISDGGTVPSLDYLANKTYVDIGSGNILKISWDTPEATNNEVDSYIAYIMKYDAVSGSYTYLHKDNIGLVNEFYLKSSLLASIAQTYFQLRIYVTAVSKHGAVYNGSSAAVNVFVSKGCGMYLPVESGYAQPIMKRSLAFAKLDLFELLDAEGKALTDADGKALVAKTASTQDDATGWALMQEFYCKDSNNNKQLSDIQYEVLLDENGDIVLDMNDSPIYIL